MKWIALLFLALCSATIQGQVPEKIQVLPLPATPTAISADVSHRLYVAVGKGIIRQYDSTGKQLAYFSPSQIATVTSLEARFGMRVYAFYQDLQSFVILNRFLQPIDIHKFNPDKIGFAQNVAWSIDRSVWVWDSQDMMLKKYNPMTTEVTLQVNLSQDMEVLRMQEFDNRLYIFTKADKLLILDYLGNIIETRACSPTSCLYAERLWTCENKQLVVTPLYTKKEQREKIFFSLEINTPALFLYVNEQYYWLFEADKITIYKYFRE